MLKKVLLKALKNLTPEEKDDVRKALVGGEPAPAQNVGEQQGNSEEQSEPAAENTASVNEAGQTADAENTEGEASAGEENGEASDPLNEENPVTEEEPAAESGQVLDISGEGNGVRIEDMVTVDMLTERLAAIDAKLNAVIDENKALKEKYENPDFGTQIKKGAGDFGNKDDKKSANQSFEEYSKQFQ
jgi:hypothetical protein